MTNNVSKVEISNEFVYVSSFKNLAKAENSVRSTYEKTTKM